MRYFRAPLSLTVAALCLTLAAPAAAQEEVKKKRQAPDGMVRFETGSTRITEASKLALDRIAEYISSQRSGDILVVGHTDRHGRQSSNLVLSKKRARTVKRELTKRKVPGSRITVMGVGSSEALSTEKSKEADNLNRRVEVWVGTREAIAWISYIYQSVQSQKPATQAWDAAKLRMQLRRLFRVRTLERSAGEVTFSEGKTLFLGPQALVVIYGKDEKKGPRTRSVADVTVEQGSLLASLGTDPVLIETQDARFDLQSNRTRLDASAAKERTTVSMYEGSAKVRAQNKTVNVEQGYGTRVRRGQAPEAPTPLPPPPVWSTRNPVVGYARRPVSVDWRPAISHPGALVEIGSIDDKTMSRPFESRVVEGSSITLSDLPPGAYLVRVSSMDERDIVGLPGQSRELVILPSPEAIDGSLTWTDNGWSMSEPGRVRLPSARGVRTSWTDAQGNPQPEEIRSVPGSTHLKVQLSDAAGTVVGSGRTTVMVRPLSLKMVEVEGTSPSESGNEVTFVVEAANGEGLPEDNLQLAVGDPDVGILETPQQDSTWMLPLTHSRTATQTFSSIGQGRYRLKWQAPAQASSGARYVLVYDGQRSMGQHVLLPVVGQLKAPQTGSDGKMRLRLRQGLHLGIAGGAERARGAFHPGFRAEIGWTVVAQDFLRLSMSIESGFTRASVPVGTVDMFPVFGRATVGFLVGPIRPYIGFAGGVRFLGATLDDQSATANLDAPKAAIEGILGLGAYFKGIELFIEGRYGPTSTSDDAGFGQVGEPGIYGGLRYYLEQG